MEQSGPSFTSLGLQSWVVKQLAAMQMTKPTQVQVDCIPAILKGKHVVGGAITGSGKTAAFALPILQQLAAEVYGVFAIVLTPSRELAYQINDQFVALGSPINVRTCIAIGGVDHGAQLEAIKARPHIIVATPGRLHMLLRTFPEVLQTIKHLRYVVIDEADRLTEGDLSEDTLEAVKLLGPPRPNRQTLFFTATTCSRLTAVSEGLLPQMGVFDAKNLALCVSSTANVAENDNPKDGNAAGAGSTTTDQHMVFKLPDTLETRYLFMPIYVKMPYLVTLLRSRPPSDSCIIFCNSCNRCEIVRLALQMLGFPVSSLNSLLNQKQRLNNLAMFKAGLAKYLVATDIAARGLDIPDVDVVIHYDFPKLSSTYVHRVGRTARAGKSGEAIALVTQADIFLVHKVERRTKHKLRLLKSEKITDEEVCRVLDEVSVAKVDATLEVEERMGSRVQRLKEVARDRRTETNRLIRTDGLSRSNSHSHSQRGDSSGANSAGGEAKANPVAGAKRRASDSSEHLAKEELADGAQTTSTRRSSSAKGSHVVKAKKRAKV